MVAGRAKTETSLVNYSRIFASELSRLQRLDFSCNFLQCTFLPGIAKWNEGWWTGDAMYHALGLDIYVTEFGRRLLDFPIALKLVSIGTVFAEVFLVWTLFLPDHNDRYRVLNLIVFWGFHIGIALSMSIGLFPFICIIAWFPLIPSGFWNWLTPNRSVAVDPLAGTNEQLRPGMLGQIFCAVMILFILVWNVANIQWKPLDRLRLPRSENLGMR